MNDINIKLSDYEKWKIERDKINNRYAPSTKGLIETRIKAQLLKNMDLSKTKNSFFNHDDLLSIEDVEDKFNVIAITGDRNIGKTYASRRLCEEAVKRGVKWVWLRNNAEEVKKFAASEKLEWWSKNGWMLQSIDSGQVIDRETDKVVGYIIPLSTSANYKSIDYPDVELVIWDEFNSQVVVQDKYNKITHLMTTIQRHRPYMKLIMTANYVSQNDEMLENFGVGVEELDDNQLLTFNWITGAIMWFIPQSCYQKTKNDDNNIGYKMSLNNYDAYSTQYGGNFKQTKRFNIVNLDRYKSIDKMFNIIIKDIVKKEFKTYTVMYAYDVNKEDIIVISDKDIDPSLDKYALTLADEVEMLDSKLINDHVLQNLLKLWNGNVIKCTSDGVHKNMLKYMVKTATKIASLDMLGEVV